MQDLSDCTSGFEARLCYLQDWLRSGKMHAVYLALQANFYYLVQINVSATVRRPLHHPLKYSVSAHAPPSRNPRIFLFLQIPESPMFDGESKTTSIRTPPEALERLSCGHWPLLGYVDVLTSFESPF